MNALKAQNALVFITGASRGIGKTLALMFADLFSDHESTFVLLSRDEKVLADVQRQILSRTLSTNVELLIADLNNRANEYDNISELIRKAEETKKFDIRIIVHNAGSVGDVTKKSSELNDQDHWHSYLQGNLISTIILNNKIYAELKKDKGLIMIVNITSLLSEKAFPSFTQYSVAKASREAYFRSFAVEHPEARVLSYSPGPVDTQMHNEISQHSYDQEVREVFSKRYSKDHNLHRKLLSTEETCRKLISILGENKFVNGSRIDYFDDESTR